LENGISVDWQTGYSRDGGCAVRDDVEECRGNVENVRRGKKHEENGLRERALEMLRIISSKIGERFAQSPACWRRAC
jgi:hypothetical protein